MKKYQTRSQRASEEHLEALLMDLVRVLFQSGLSVPELMLRCQKTLIQEALRETQGSITETSLLLGVSRGCVYRWVRKL